MLRLILVVFVFVCFASCNETKPKTIKSNHLKYTNITIIETGVPDLESTIQCNSLAKMYGVEFCSIGCVVTPSKMDSIQKVNNKTYEILNKRFGKNWRRNFYSKLDTVNQIRLQADSVLNAHFPNDNKHLYYLVLHDSTKNNYQVKAYSVDSLDGNPVLIIHYKMAIATEKESKFYITKTFEKL